MPQPIANLTDHFGYWLRQVSNHVSHAFARRLTAKGVTVAEWALMRVLHDEPPLAPSRVAAVMGLTRGAVTKLADRLVAKSLAVRRASPDDGRAQTLALTTAGRDFVPELAALAEQNEAACFAHLPEADRHALQRILQDMVRHLGVTAMPLA